MRKAIIYFIGIILIIFLIPVICTIRPKSETVDKPVNEINNITTSTYDYKDYETISLLHKKTNKIEKIPLDEYLYGVVSAEMPASFEEEALKAQAVVARTYTIYKIKNSKNKHGDAQICDDSTCCQAWISKEDRMQKWKEEERESNWNKIVNAVNNTQGKIITYNGEPIDAFFHSNSGGKTEIPVNVWGGTGFPYLQVVESSGEENYNQYNSEVTISKKDFENKIKEKYNDFKIDFKNKDCIKIKDYTEGGRVKNIQIGNKTLSGVEVRTLFNLKSANFEFTINENDIKFTVKGYGHGIGMSQTGADSMAKKGSSYEDIIHHFYTGVEIKDM